MRDELIMEMASRIISLRLGRSVRGPSPLASSIHVSSLPRCAYPGYGIFWADSVCDPANAGKIGAIIEESFRGFASEGPTPDELAAAKRLTLHALKARMDDPAWVAHELAQMTYRDRDLREIAAARAMVAGMSASELRLGFASALHHGPPVSVTTQPAGPTDAENRGDEPIHP